jgi:Zn-dependent M28 family amino/carboxypeptidase
MNPELTPMKYDLVFAGYGIFAPEKNVDDFAGAEVKGKAVVSLLAAPWPLDPAVVHAYDRAVGKSVHVTVRGGKLLVYVSEEIEAPPEAPSSAEVGFLREYSKIPLAYLPEFQGKPTMAVCPSLIIIPSAFDKTLAKLTGGTYADWKKRLPTKKFKTQTLNASIEIRVETKPQEGKACNVVAMLSGTDSSLKDEWVVLTAHYDHLGFHEAPPSQDGIYNGADDNASGTAAVLEIARRLAEARPRRSLLILYIVKYVVPA